MKTEDSPTMNTFHPDAEAALPADSDKTDVISKSCGW